jgi:hypothetical protein
MWSRKSRSFDGGNLDVKYCGVTITIFSPKIGYPWLPQNPTS